MVLEASCYPEWREELAASAPLIGRHGEFIRGIDPFDRLKSFWPRPIFMLCGDLDTDQPKVYSVRLYCELLPLYADRPERPRLSIYDGARHEVTPQMLEDVCDWFSAHLNA